jgi:hypothetical protein
MLRDKVCDNIGESVVMVITDKESLVMSESVKERVPVDICKPETCPKPLQKFYSDKERENILKAVAAGDIVTSVKNVKISAKKSGTGSAELWPYIHYKAVKGPGMGILSRGLTRASVKLPDNYKSLSAAKKLVADADNTDGACDYFDYGFTLTITQPIRIMLDSSLAGVDKQVDKQVRQVMKTGLFTEDQARTFVINQREKLKLEVPQIDSDDDTDDDTE